MTPYLSALGTYTRQARLKPALIVLLPVLLVLIAYYPNALSSWMLLPGLLATCGGTMLLAQIARSTGKRKEPVLFHEWGGKPTTLLLRHEGVSNKVQRERRHRQLQTLLPDISHPDAKQEGTDPTAADAIYDMCTEALRELTRDRERFHLLFDENCSYGFRRNLWAMKPLGLALAVACTFVIATLLIHDLYVGHAISFLPVAVVSVNASLSIWWIVIINPDWVKEQAYTYAEQLLAACEQLEARSQEIA